MAGRRAISEEQPAALRASWDAVARPPATAVVPQSAPLLAPAPAVEAARQSAPALGQGAPASDAVAPAVLARTHQIDGQPATVWDTTRCAAASGVTIAAACGAGYLRALARLAVAEVEQRQAGLAALSAAPDAPGADLALLVAVERHLSATGMTPRLAAERLGCDPCARGDCRAALAALAAAGRPAAIAIAGGSGADGFALLVPGAEPLWVAPAAEERGDLHVRPLSAEERVATNEWLALPAEAGAPADLAAVIAQLGAAGELRHEVPWLRAGAPGPDGRAPLAVERKAIELALPACVLGIARLSGRLPVLLEELREFIEWQLDKTRATARQLERPSAPEAETLQALADELVFVARRTARGANAYYIARLLADAGLATSRPSAAGALPFADCARALAPGEHLWLSGSAHAVALGRLDDGRCYLYDSEGLGGDRQRPALQLLGRDPDLGPASELGAYYRGFAAQLKVGRYPPRLPRRDAAPWPPAAPVQDAVIVTESTGLSG